MIRREQEQLIQSAFDGPITPPMEVELADLLRNSHEAREAWCDHTLLLGDLKQQASLATSQPGRIPPSAAYAMARQRNRHVIGSLAAAAAVLTLGAWVLGAVFAKPRGRSFNLTSSAGTLLVAKNGEPFTDHNLHCGQFVAIQQGMVRLDLPGGVLGIIEGPGTLLAETPSRLRFTGGRGFFHVPADAKGFTVVGPTIEATDLGTEFGVDFRDAYRARASVFKGRIEVRATAGRREHIELHAGEAVQLSPAGTFYRSNNLGHFATSLPADLPELRLDFDRIEHGTTPIDGTLTSAQDLTASIVADDPDAVRLVPGIVGSAIDFRGNAEIVSDWPGIQGEAPRTVALWFRTHPGADYRSAPPLVFWGLASGFTNHKFKLSLATESDGLTYSRISLGRWYANGSTPISDSEWHHLAAVWEGKFADGKPRVRLYLDGRTENFSYINVSSITDFSTDTFDPAARPLSIGRYELPPTTGTPFFHGAIDELRVIAGALKPDQIAAMAERPH